MGWAMDPADVEKLVGAIRDAGDQAAAGGVWLEVALVVATIAAAIAAGFSAWAAIIGPRKVAEEAERLRREGERRDFKIRIFGQILADRPRLATPKCAQALNSIDVAFRDSQPVLDAWARLHRSLAGEGDTATMEQLRKDLLRRIGEDVGFGDALTEDIVSREYDPLVLRAEFNGRAVYHLKNIGYTREQAFAMLGLPENPQPPPPRRQG